MADIKIIFLDVDDTLLCNRSVTERYIPPENIEMIHRAKSKGIHVVLTTGRSLPITIPIAKEVGLENDYIICTGGAVISHQGKIHRDDILTNTTTQRLTEFIVENNIYSQYYKGDHYYVDKETEYTSYYELKTKFKSTIIGNEIYQMKDVRRITMVMKTQEMKEQVFEFLKTFDDITIGVFWDNWVEVDSISATKGNAIKHVCELLNIKPEETMGIGDAENDITMWDVVGYKVVMGQAKDELKEGKIITDTCENAGVAKAIAKYCFNEDI